MLGGMATTVEAVRGKQLGARARILETTYVLFAQSELTPHFRYLEDTANDRPARSSRRSQRSWACS
jgi:hypothetical protein